MEVNYNSSDVIPGLRLADLNKRVKEYLRVIKVKFKDGPEGLKFEWDSKYVRLQSMTDSFSNLPFKVIFMYGTTRFVQMLTTKEGYVVTLETTKEKFKKL